MVALLCAFAVSHWSSSSALYADTTAGTGDTFDAAASYPDYPTNIVDDDPLFYYRLDDPAGSVTATDSSGHGNPGVYGGGKFVQSPIGLWPLDENAGATARDMSASPTPHDLSPSGASWTAAGRNGAALSFNGTSDYAATATSVVTTNASFSVAAWVYLTDTSVTRTVISQRGTAVNAFELGYDRTIDRWAFAMYQSDSTAATANKATSTAAPDTATWVQLTATFDAGTNAMRLYVNGQAQTGGTFGGTPWNATGALEVGAGFGYNGVSSVRRHFWQGRVDNVRAYNRAVQSPEGPRELTIGTSGGAGTAWQFDENTGTTAVDSAGHLNTGTFGAAATWGAPGTGTASVDLTGDGSGDSYVSGAAAGVKTSASFTVSAWVYLDHTTLAAKSRVAVSQSGPINSGFTLRYNYYGTQWEFAVNKGTSTDYSPQYISVYSAVNSAALATWTHLVGVYDAAAQTVTLYVDGVAQAPASTAGFGVHDANGPLQVGRVKEFGAWQTGTVGGEAWGPWAGRIDDVRVFRRALDLAEITAVRNGGRSYATLGLPGALQGTLQAQKNSTAMAFAATESRASYHPISYANPTTYSLECWFRYAGGGNVAPNGVTLMSFGSAASGNSAQYDRKLIIDVSGRVAMTTDTTSAQSTASYADSAWHHVVGTVSPTTGIRLYVDGTLVTSVPYAAPANYTGYWRWAGETWPGVTADYFHLGELDEIAVYDTVLSQDQVQRHYFSNH